MRKQAHWIFRSIFGVIIGVAYLVSAMIMIHADRDYGQGPFKGLGAILVTYPYWIVTEPFRSGTAIVGGKYVSHDFSPFYDGSSLEWALAPVFCYVLVYLIGAVIQKMASLMIDSFR